MPDYKILPLGAHTIDYLHQGHHKEPLLFLHGYGVGPHAYQPLLDGLATQYDVVAPRMYGLNCFTPQPTTLEEYVELTQDFCTALKLPPYHLAGHSMGGGVGSLLASQSSSTQTVTLLNPLMPVDFGLVGFVWKEFAGLMASLEREETRRTLANGRKVLGPLVLNFLKKSRASLALIRSLSGFTYQERITQPALLLYGEQDNWFSLTPSMEQAMCTAIPDLTVKRLPDRGHQWPLHYPSQATEELLAFLTAKSSGSPSGRLR